MAAGTTGSGPYLDSRLLGLIDKLADMQRLTSVLGEAIRVTNEEIEINGETMTMTEVELRSIQRKAAKGDVAASRHLAKLRADAGVGQSPQGGGGVLVVPGTRPLHEWSISAAIQQAQFREQSEDDQ